MKPFLPSSDEEFSIFEQPVPIAAYTDLPELQAKYTISLRGEPVPDIIIHILGTRREIRTAKKIRDTIPDMEIVELDNILYYDGILYSPQRGKILVDSARSFQNNLNPNLFYGPTSRLKNIGNGNYVPDTPPPPELKAVSSNHVFMPCFTSYQVYGHWLLEAVTSLWALPHIQALAGNQPVKLLLSPVEKVPAYMKLFAEPLGITDYDFYFPSQCMKLAKLFIPTKAYMHMAYVSDIAKDIWKRIADYFLPRATIDPKEKIFLSRKKVRTRRLENQDEIESFFEQQGFAIIHAQELSLPDQICLFAHATHIAGPVGSAAHNVVFSQRPEELKTFFFGPSDYTSYNAMAVIEQAYGRNAYFSFGTERTTERRSWHLPLHEIQTAHDQWQGE